MESSLNTQKEELRKRLEIQHEATFWSFLQNFALYHLEVEYCTSHLNMAILHQFRHWEGQPPSENSGVDVLISAIFGQGWNRRKLARKDLRATLFLAGVQLKTSSQ